jgi:hypothetical protein
MQNLEQIRARNALKLGVVAGDEGGEVIKKVAPLVLNNGLLATAAYSFAESSGWPKVFDAIAQHLADPDIGIAPAWVKDRSSLMKFLTGAESTSETLKIATSETMAWLVYARRFSKKA